MRITARVSAILCVIFAFICLGVAITGFSSLGEITDPAKLADAKGFSWFWTFLAVVSAVFGVLSWWIVGKEVTDPSAASK
jgi:succinate dehydrogenase hydrophobic anchor subunit